MYSEVNYVKIAVERLGGPTMTAHLAAVSNASIHAWMKHSRIPNLKKAKIVAAAAKLDVQFLRGTR